MIGSVIKHWIRFSDGCTSQFNSRYTTADLEDSVEEFDLETAADHYYESHDGKNISDSIRCIVNAALRRAIYKADSQVNDVKRIVELVRGEVAEKTEKFQHFIVEAF